MTDTPRGHQAQTPDEKVRPLVLNTSGYSDDPTAKNAGDFVRQRPTSRGPYPCHENAWGRG